MQAVGVKARPGVWVHAGKQYCGSGHGVHRLITEVRVTHIYSHSELQIHLILAFSKSSFTVD